MKSISQLLERACAQSPDAIAIQDRERSCSYAELQRRVDEVAASLLALNPKRLARVAVFLDKTLECVVILLAVWRAGLIAVPVNPKLKPAQVGHILTDSGAGVLLTTMYRLHGIAAEMDLGSLHVIVMEGQTGARGNPACASLHWWEDWSTANRGRLVRGCTAIDSDPAALMYTSGSTGMPKGVVVTHRNLVAGCLSVNAYLETSSQDVILALLPLSFDAGLSQLTTSIAAAARLVLHNYLMPKDVPALCASAGVTSITAVPPLWIQLAAQPWPEKARASLRLFANTGGQMQRPLLARLRALFPQAKPFLMYGLTEAFRSTYLDPAEVDRRPDSIGKAIPNCEILVLRADGTPCDTDEPGELVHRGPHVALGYWNDAARTAERFRPLENILAEGLTPQFAVWSGDIVRRDAEGFLYFMGRRDDQIKVSGYRVSPAEIESVLAAVAEVVEVTVFGVSDEQLGQVPVAAVVGNAATMTAAQLTAACGMKLPSYMVPRIMLLDELPRSPNGKFDRAALRSRYLSSLSQRTGMDV